MERRDNLMPDFDEWERIAARIRGLSDATTALWRGVELKGCDYHGLTNSWLIPSAKDLIAEIEAFRSSHGADIGPAALDSLTRGLDKLRALGVCSGIPLTASLIAGLMALESEVSFHLRDFDASVRPVVERAFLHLQRSLVVDADMQKRWLAAFEAIGETGCERLGAVHLLLHGIYAFKTSAKGERTDLVLGDRLSVDPRLRRSANALVLTEWKAAHSDEEAQRKFQQAQEQARRYGEGVLAGFELHHFRYLVLVSRDYIMRIPDDAIVEDVTYRYVNIAISPSVPSRARTRESLAQ